MTVTYLLHIVFKSLFLLSCFIYVALRVYLMRKKYLDLDSITKLKSKDLNILS